MQNFVVVAVQALAYAAMPDYDVVVYGSTPAGIAAAVSAGYLGHKVALYEPLVMIGGMGAAGNLALHDGSSATSTFTGLAQNFTMLNAEYYGVKRPVAQPESFVANASFWKMLANAGVTKVELNCRLTGASVGSTKASVQSISVLCEKDPVTATVFIDASYDGEIMVLATHSTYGRESIAEYNESLAGARVPTKFSTATGNPSPQVNALHPNGTILKYVQNISTLAAPGEADGALMAFQHRLCISGDASNKLPWKQPANYVADDFLLFLRYIEASDDNQTFNGFGFPGQDMHGSGYPGSKKKYTLCCGVTIAASDQPHLNAGWATASWEEKLAITAEYTYFELGMFYFLANDPRVPSPVKAKFNSYGICADEFQEWDGIPPQLYIRASNRMVGDFVLTQNSIINPAYKEDSIATGKWWFDEVRTYSYAVPYRTSYYLLHLLCLL
tara:strand:- start:627 stop:1958 length:1332 start_codon:yes stop_codon:yes gene_type:complete